MEVHRANRMYLWGMIALAMSAIATGGQTEERSTKAVGPQPKSIYEMIKNGMKCGKPYSGGIDCTYSALDVEFTIVGIGQPYGWIQFNRSDSSGLLYAGYGMSHGCIVIEPGEKSHKDDLAKLVEAERVWVSPKNGKIYRDWSLCGLGQ